MHDSLPDSEAVLAQFNRLIQELLRGNLHRNTFRPWEIEILLDIEGCSLKESAKRETLKRYQKAVQRHMDKGARLPLKLSEYLDAVKAKRAAQAAQQAASPAPVAPPPKPAPKPAAATPASDDDDFDDEDDEF